MRIQREEKDAQRRAGNRFTTSISGRMQLDSVSLVASSGANAFLGVLFWVAATRLYPVDAVGRATTVITTVTVLSALANLSLGPVLERFLPGAGRRRRRWVLTATLSSLVASTVVGLVFVGLDPARIVTGPADAVVIVLTVMVLSAFSLLDSVLIGLHRGRWAALKNTSHAVVKLIVVVAAASVGSGTVLVLGWVVPALIAVLVVQGVLLLGRRVLADDRPPDLPATADIVRYGAVSFGWTMAASVPGLVLPLLVLAKAGVEAAAFFNISWTVVGASLLVMSLATGPFVSAGSRPGADLAGLTRSFVKILLIVSLIRGVAVGVAGPLVLQLYGTEYAQAGRPLLIVMGIAHLISGPAYLYGSLARINRRITYPMTVQALGSALVVVLVLWWLPQWGIVAVAWATLAQDLFVLLAATPPLIILLRKVFGPTVRT